MKSSMGMRAKAILVVALVLVSGIGGYIGWWYMQPKAFSTVSGIVHLDEPIVDATVSVYSLDGVKIFEEKDATHTTGSFVIKVGWGAGQWNGYVPNDFVIAATGGTIDNEPFTGTIVRRVRNYSEGHYYFLNAVTTLIQGYLDKHPDLTYDEAEETVKDFLGVPEFMGMNLVVDSAMYYQRIFDHEYFMLKAEEHADFDTFVDTLLGEIHGGGQRIFVASGGDEGVFEKIMGMVGEGIGQGIADFGAEMALGWVLRTLGFKDTDTKLDEISKKLDEVMAGVHRIEQDIAEVKQELNEIRQAIEKLQELEYQIALKDKIQVIESNFNKLQQYARQKSVDQSDLEKFRESILDSNSGVYQAMDAIHAFVKGYEPSLSEPGELERLTHNIVQHAVSAVSYEDYVYDNPGTYELFLQYMKKNDRSGLDNYLKNLYERFLSYYSTLEEYFSKYLLIQIRGVNLIVEAYLYHNQTSLARDYVKNIFTPHIKAQTEVFLRCVDTLVFNVNPTPMAEFPNMGPLPKDHESSEYIAQIYPRADRFADKCAKFLSGERYGAFKARVLLSNLKPELRTNDLTPIGGQPILEFSPYDTAGAPKQNWKTGKNNLAFQLCGTEGSSRPRPDLNDQVNAVIGPGPLEAVKVEERQVTILANAPSRWALPAAVIDYGKAEYDTEKVGSTAMHLVEGRAGQIDLTVPYKTDGTVTYLLFDYGGYAVTPGYYRILNWQKADHVNEGTGWVMDYERTHIWFTSFDKWTGDPKSIKDQNGNWMDYWYHYVSWMEGTTLPARDARDQPSPEVVVYLGFKPGPYDMEGSTVINPWKYHLYDGYELSRNGYIQLVPAGGDSVRAGGGSYGYWGGYWRQEAPS